MNRGGDEATFDAARNGRLGHHDERVRMRLDRRSPARLEDSHAVGHSSENLLENVAIDNLKL